MRKSLILPSILLVLEGCGPSRPVPSNGSAGTGVVYGDDSRREPSRKDAAAIRQASTATAAIIRRGTMKALSGHWRIAGGVLGKQRNLCPEVKFSKQMTAAHCTGVLIAPNKLLTAGHCVEHGCDDFRIVFGWTAGSGNSIPNKNVYRCTKVLRLELSDEDLEAPDFAILQLDRYVQGRKPVKISDAPMKVGEELLIVGYPNGIPQKISKGRVRATESKYFATVTSDTFTGDSGGPIFSTDGSLKGLLIGGEDDFIFDHRGCKIINVCANDGCRGEDALKVKEALASPK